MSSCSESKTDNEPIVPEGVQLIDKPTFVKVFAEAQLIESHISVLRTYQPYFKDSVNNYFKAMFDKYEVTSDDFYYSLKEYSKDTKEMNSIIDESIAMLQSMEGELGDVQPIKKDLNTLSRQQIGDIVFETPIKNLMINGVPEMVEIYRDTLFHYLDSFPDIVTEKGYDMESVRFSFILNTNSKMMYNQLITYLKNKNENQVEGNTD